MFYMCVYIWLYMNIAFDCVFPENKSCIILTKKYVYVYVCISLYTSVQFSTVTQSCPTLCNSMDCSTPGLLIHHQFLNFTKNLIH